MAMDCPVDILHLSDERYTAGNAHDQALWAKQDVWDLNDSNWQSEKAWTGVTIFPSLKKPDKPVMILRKFFTWTFNSVFPVKSFSIKTIWTSGRNRQNSLPW
jgi:hypothetical protein